jgi:hypothetical protein
MISHPKITDFRQAPSGAPRSRTTLALGPLLQLTVVSRSVSSDHGSLRMTNSCSDFRGHYRHCVCGGRK